MTAGTWSTGVTVVDVVAAATVVVVAADASGPPRPLPQAARSEAATTIPATATTTRCARMPDLFATTHVRSSWDGTKSHRMSSSPSGHIPDQRRTWHRLVNRH